MEGALEIFDLIKRINILNPLKRSTNCTKCALPK